MPARQEFLIRHQAAVELLWCIAVVMKMHFNLAEPLPTELCQSVEVFRVVLLERIEKGMTWGPTVSVPEFSEQAGIVVEPTANAFSSQCCCSAPVSGLKMVGNAEDQVNWIAGMRTPT